MSYKQPGYIRQAWWVIKFTVRDKIRQRFNKLRSKYRSTNTNKRRKEDE